MRVRKERERGGEEKKAKNGGGVQIKKEKAGEEKRAKNRGGVQRKSEKGEWRRKRRKEMIREEKGRGGG